MFSRSLLDFCGELTKTEEILPQQLARLACKSIHILESKNIEGKILYLILFSNHKISNLFKKEAEHYVYYH